MAYNNRRRGGGSQGSRWMTLRFPGKCKVCGAAIPAGETAYWDKATKKLTCQQMDCCDADGLTTMSSPTGPWDQRTDLRVRTDRRIGAPAPSPGRVIVTRFNSGAVMTVNSRGRCLDAPCCGCCT